MTAEEIKAVVPLEKVLSSMYGHEVKSSMDCPIHGGDKCFSIRGEYFKCFSCGVSGDAFVLVQELSNTDFAGAKALICEFFNLNTSYTSKKEKQRLRSKIEASKKEQERKQILKKLRNFQQDRICQTLRALQTADGDSFPERHLTELSRRYEQNPQFILKHDVQAHLTAIILRYGTGAVEQIKLLEIFYGITYD